MSRTIVITGANRGIGLAFTKIYKQNGDNVIALCRQSSPELEQLGGTVVTDIDVASDAGLAKMMTALAGITIDILINNAGILRDENLSNFNNQTIIEQFMVNALAPINVCQRLQKNLSSGSKVALITSRMGSIADNDSGGRYGYRMSKAALNAAGKSLAVDLANRDIATGIYHPGYVQTDMVNHNGDISADVAAGRLVNLIDDLSLANTGVFYHSNGQILPW
ncbi:SDR family oxidoreductase [Thalassomonas sp. M1454]|uniref:SDR family oxidoreductase n=1 Tax=Thalassomonas sp. M1454 TaxID=2594477 RepID=UPI00117CAA85|nr:SDR family oxidoreductase [Thalassomonas sp. M1454]TRX55716.1 SDR family oxidoreductase [Thalassomonas sp. M1454]